MDEENRPHRWPVAIATAIVAGSCVAATDSLCSAPAFLAFVAAVVVSTVYGGLGTGLFTAIGGWAFSNVCYLDPIGELSVHGRAIGLLAAYVTAAAIGYMVRHSDEIGAA